MNVLFVDDSISRQEALKAALRDIPEVRLYLADSGNAAAEILKGVKIDFLIVDLCFPSRSDGIIQFDAGLNLVELAVSGVIGAVPDHVIGVSANDTGIATARDRFAELGWPLYSLEDGQEIPSAVAARIRQSVKARLEPAERIYDVVWLTAQHDGELEGALAVIGEHSELVPTDFGSVATIKRENGQPIRLLVTAATSMGAVDAAAYTAYLTAQFRPSIVCMSGIAAGISTDIALGDVVLATHAWDVESGKVVTNHEGVVRQASPSPIPARAWVVARLKKFSVEFNARSSSGFRVFAGPFAMVNAVIADAQTASSLTSGNRKFVALEMESFALFRACELCPFGEPIALIAKGISDRADLAKGDEFRVLSSERSARVLLDLIIDVSDALARRTHA